MKSFAFFQDCIPAPNQFVLVFDYHLLYFVCSCNRDANLGIMFMLRLVAFSALVADIIASAKLYESYKSGHLPNDGDPVTWILYFFNVVALMTLLYFLWVICLTLPLCRPKIKNGDTKQFFKYKRFRVMHLLFITILPLTYLSIIEYFQEFLPNSSSQAYNTSTVIITFVVMNLDFLFMRQVLLYENWIYPFSVVLFYLLIVMIVSFTTNVYPELPWMNNPGVAFGQSVLVLLITVFIYFCLSYVSQVRYHMSISANSEYVGYVQVKRSAVGLEEVEEAEILQEDRT